MKKKNNFDIEYDYLLVGAGLFNAIFAREATLSGKKCLVIDKRSHIGGNLFCENIENIMVHKYGPHIFHTNNKDVWAYMNKICDFNHFKYSPLANYKDELYNLPFNMNTFYQLWKVKTPCDAKQKIKEQIIVSDDLTSLEDYAISVVGKDIYNKLIKGYTEKQWGRPAKELPASIIKRIPLRFTFDNNYFTDNYQGIPQKSYNAIFDECFKNCTVLLNVDFLKNRDLRQKAKTMIYTGMIDEYFDFCYGSLEYRSLSFMSESLGIDNYQGNAAINYTDFDIPYTRIIEHKHFINGNQPNTVITKEFPQQWTKGVEPYYPINTDRNQNIYQKYKELSRNDDSIYFAGRLGYYEYLNMDQIVEKAISLSENLLTKH